MYGRRITKRSKFNSGEALAVSAQKDDISAMKQAYQRTCLELRGFTPAVDKYAASVLLKAVDAYKTIKQFDEDATMDSHCDTVLYNVPFYSPLSMNHLAASNAQHLSAKFGKARRRFRALIVMHEINNAMELVPTLGAKWVLSNMIENNASALSLYVYGKIFDKPGFYEEAYVNDNGKTESLPDVVQALMLQHKKQASEVVC